MIEGWCNTKLKSYERIMFGIGGLLLMIPGLHTDLPGLIFSGLGFYLQYRRAKGVVKI
jgi:uncharacterized membrane protein